jgi:hypothetical protein
MFRKTILCLIFVSIVASALSGMLIYYNYIFRTVTKSFEYSCTKKHFDKSQRLEFASLTLIAHLHNFCSPSSEDFLVCQANLLLIDGNFKVTFVIKNFTIYIHFFGSVLREVILHFF